MEMKSFIKTAKNDIKNDKVKFCVYLVLRIFVIASLVMALIRQEYENAFVCILSLALFLAPTFIEKSLKIDLPSTLEIIVLLFIFSAEILGEIHNYYMKVPYWDTILHTLNGFLFAAFGFSLLDIINRNPKFKFQLSPMYLAVVAFSFSMTIGVLWEFFEFGADYFLNKDMQKDVIIHTINSVTLDPNQQNVPHTISNISSVVVNGKDMGLGGYLDIGLYDTMKDLLVNFVGALVFSFIGYFYIKNRGKGEFAKHFIPVIDEEAEDKAIEDTKKNSEQ